MMVALASVLMKQTLAVYPPSLSRPAGLPKSPDFRIAAIPQMSAATRGPPRLSDRPTVCRSGKQSIGGKR